MRDMSPHLPAGVHFVPAPVAGTEYSADAGRRALRQPLVHPHAAGRCRQAGGQRLAAFWRALGANVRHDGGAPRSRAGGDEPPAPSHRLPIVGTADELSQVTRSEVLQFSAGGFRDFTRIAASDPTMWRDVFLASKGRGAEMLGLQRGCSKLARAIRRGDGEARVGHLARTRAIRKGIVAVGQDSRAPECGRPHPDRPPEPMPRTYAAENE